MIQYAFLIIAVINVPILLFGTPIEFLVKQKKTNAAHKVINTIESYIIHLNYLVLKSI